MIRVLALDGHLAILEALSSSVARESDFQLCGTTNSVDEALHLVQTERPDVVVLEVNLPTHYGLDVANQLRKKRSNIKLVFYSMCPEVIYAERALRVGASAFIMKSEPTSAVIGAIRRVMNDEIVLSETITQHMLLTHILEMESEGESPADLHVTSNLTDRELAVFNLLGRGKSVQEIAKSLGLATKSIETYRSRLREKLGLDSNEELMSFAFECSEPASMSR